MTEEVEFATTLRRSIERAAASSGVVDLILADNHNGPTSLRNVERFIESGADLVIEYLHLTLYGEVIMSRSRAAGIPAISINAPMAGARYVGVDNDLVGRLGDAAPGGGGRTLGTRDRPRHRPQPDAGEREHERHPRGASGAAGDPPRSG